MQTMYMDNASTSFPKAPGVGAAMAKYIDEIGVNVMRGTYAPALGPEGAMLALRERLCALFGSDCVEGCILTPGATFGLNMVLKGLASEGSHVLLTPLQHNAVMRPLRQMEGADVELAPYRADGTLDLADFEGRIKPNTAAVVCNAACNVCGALSPVGALGELCARRGVPFVVDASQAVGHVPLDCNAMHIDALIFSAHKGLLGPQGIGAAILTRALAERLPPFVTGGTGSHSDRQTQPSELPDKLEAGTPNLPGVYGWLAALDFGEARAQELMAKEKKLTALFLDGLQNIPQIRVPGPSAGERAGVISVDFVRRDNAEVALRLEQEYGILTRCGLQCAPAAHRALGTFPQGTVRFSLGWKNTESEIALALSAIQALA